jgi:hypothetical protein
MVLAFALWASACAVGMAAETGSVQLLCHDQGSLEDLGVLFENKVDAEAIVSAVLSQVLMGHCAFFPAPVSFTVIEQEETKELDQLGVDKVIPTDPANNGAAWFALRTRTGA